MITDRSCLDCRDYTFRLVDATGGELHIVDSRRASLIEPTSVYTDVTCRECGRTQALVLQPGAKTTVFTLWPCSWNDEPCMEDGCDYCNGEYV